MVRRDSSYDARAFREMVAGLSESSEIVSEWRLHNAAEYAAIAENHLETGTHIIECHLDKEARILTILTELGISMELAYAKANEAISFMLMIDAGEAEVLTSFVDSVNTLTVSLTDGSVIVTGSFDVTNVSAFGFFD
jgi:hypothetical protein